jgi:RHS repeat-associated protein
VATDATLSSLTFPDTTSAGEVVPASGTTLSYSQPYAFAPGSTFSATVAVTATDLAGYQTTEAFTVTPDTIGPVVTFQMAETVPLHFTVAWSGLDPSTGSGQASGLRDYDVEVSQNGGLSWDPWLSGVTATSATRLGEAGGVYHFRVRAWDNVSNDGAWEVFGPVVVATVTKYYWHGGQRVAMRRGEVVYYLSGDHLGSTSLTTCGQNCGEGLNPGDVVSEVRYQPYGQERWNSGATPTDFGFTSQRKEGFGLYDYNARYYSPGLGRFISPDTLVPEPGSSGGFNRYRYTRNNPLRYTDPSGHCSRLSSENAVALKSPCDFPGGGYASPSTGVEGGSGGIVEILLFTTAYALKLVQEAMQTKDQIEVTVDLAPQKRPDPKPTVECCLIPRPDDDKNIVRVRHYSQFAIDRIQSEMLIRPGRSGPAIWVEYPIITSYDPQDIRKTTELFVRPLSDDGGFVEFNVDLDKWNLQQDPNLPYTTNAKMIWLLTKQGELHLEGFPLSEPEVDPEFFDREGNRR